MDDEEGLCRLEKSCGPKGALMMASNTLACVDLKKAAGRKRPPIMAFNNSEACILNAKEWPKFLVAPETLNDRERLYGLPNLGNG